MFFSGKTLPRQSTATFDGEERSLCGSTEFNVIDMLNLENPDGPNYLPWHKQFLNRCTDMDEMITFLWKNMGSLTPFVFALVTLAFAGFVWIIFKHGFRKNSLIIIAIFTWIFLWLFINVIKPQGLGWSFYRLIFYIHPWMTTLLAFIAYISFKWNQKYIVIPLLAWSLMFALNFSRPDVLNQLVKPPMWWEPGFVLYELNAVWILVSLVALIYICFDLLTNRDYPVLAKFSIPYFLYVGAILFTPFMFAFAHGYRITQGDDPLGLFNTISMESGISSGSYLLGSLITFYIGYFMLLTSIVLISRRLLKTRFRMFKEIDPIASMRQKLKGRHLDYLEKVIAGLSNAEIASEMNTDKSTVSKQLYNIKRKLNLKEDLRTHIKRMNLESDPKS